MIINRVSSCTEKQVEGDITASNADGWTLIAILPRTGIGDGLDRFWCFWGKDTEA